MAKKSLVELMAALKEAQEHEEFLRGLSLINDNKQQDRLFAKLERIEKDHRRFKNKYFEMRYPNRAECFKHWLKVEAVVFGFYLLVLVILALIKVAL